MVVSIGTPLLGLRVFHAADMLRDRAPWQLSSPGTIESTNPIFGDTVSTFMPLHAEFRRAVLSGDLPLWTPYPAGGHPLAAVPDSGSLGPLNLPYLLFPLWYAPGIAKLIEMVVAAGFTFLFLRRLKLRVGPALFGGFVFCLSGFQIAWTNWPQSHVGALIPALFWAVERSIQGRTLRSSLPIPLVVAAMVFEGFPAVTGYAMLGAAIYAVARVYGEHPRMTRAAARRLGLVAGAFVLGLGLTALQLLPFAARSATLDLGYRVQTPEAHLPLEMAPMLAVPNGFGVALDPGFYGPLNYPETQAFVGSSTLVLVGVAAALRRKRYPPGASTFLWVATVIALSAIYLGGPLLAVLQTVPFFKLAAVGRLRSLACFFLACLAAVGLDRAFEPSGDRGRGRLRLALVGLAGMGLFAAGIGALWRTAEGAGQTEYLRGELIIPTASAVVALVSVAASRRFRPGAVPVAVWVVPVLFAVEALTAVLPYWPRVSRGDFYPSTPAHVFLDRRLGGDRFVGGSGVMFPGATTFYRLRSLTTNNTLPPQQTWNDLLEEVDPTAFDTSPVYPSLGSDAEMASSPILDRLAVRYYVTPIGIPVYGRRELVSGPVHGEREVGTASLPISIPAGGLRAVAVELTRQVSPELDARLTVEVLDAHGELLTTGERLVIGRHPGRFDIPVVEPDCPPCPGPFRVEISLRGERGRVWLATDDVGRPAVSVVRPAEDGLRIEMVENVVGYRRLRALPRIHWAGSGEFVPEADDRIEWLRREPGSGEVVLSEPGADGSGAGAAIRVVEDSADRIRVDVRAEGSGYLVVADALQQGWRAYLDGEDAAVRRADHAVVAVLVPEGSHHVELRYVPPGWYPGLAVSLASAALLLTLGMGGRRMRGERSRSLRAP